MTTRAEIVAEARRWEGVKYKHAGRNEHGLDCAGLIIKIANNCGFTDYDTTNYSRRPVPQEFIREMRDHLEQIPKGEIKNGDIMLFAEPRHPCHTGVYEIDDRGQEWVIHAYALARKVIREPLTKERRARWRMAFRFQGVED